MCKMKKYEKYWTQFIQKFVKLYVPCSSQSSSPRSPEHPPRPQHPPVSSYKKSYGSYFSKINMCVVKPCVEPGRPVRRLQLLGRVLLDEVPLEVLSGVAQPEQGDGGVGEVVGQEPVVLDVEAVADGVPGDSYV